MNEATNIVKCKMTIKNQMRVTVLAYIYGPWEAARRESDSEICDSVC